MFFSKIRKAFLLGLVFYSINVPTLLCMEPAKTNVASQETQSPSQEDGKIYKAFCKIVGIPLTFVGKKILQPATNAAEQYGSCLFPIKKASESKSWTKICNWLLRNAKDAVVQPIQEVLDDIQDVSEADSESDEQDNPPSRNKKLWALLFITISITPHFSDAVLRIVPQADDKNVHQQIIAQYEEKYPQEVFVVDPNDKTVFDRMQYDVCHDKSDGTIQCCKVHDNVLIECCRFIPKEVAVCGFIILEGSPEGNYLIDSKGTITQFGINPSPKNISTHLRDEKTVESLKTDISTILALKTNKKFLHYGYGYLDFEKLESMAPSFIDYYISKIQSHFSKKVSISSFSIDYDKDSKATAAVDHIIYPNSTLTSEKIISIEITSNLLKQVYEKDSFSQLYAIFGHEQGHAIQEKTPYRSIFSSLMSMLIRLLYGTLKQEMLIKHNIETNADILSGLVTENPSILAIALIFLRKKTAIEEGILEHYIFIDGSQKTIEGGPFTKKSTLCESSLEAYGLPLFEITRTHPSTYRCRVPLLLEFHEKYERLNQMLRERAKIELLDEK